jgi:hypothetical protein
VADTSVKISIEIADKAAQIALSNFIKKSEDAEKSLQKTQKTGSDTFSEIGISIAKSAGIYDIFVGNLAANLATKAFEEIASAAHFLFETFIVEGIKAAAAQEAAVNSLNVSLIESGIYTKEVSEDFVKFANNLQKTTRFQDDIILKNAALIQSMGHLDKDALKRATQAALDLSEALDKDIGTASEALAKAANGNITTLQKMGFEIQKGRNDAETFANALDAVEGKFSGAAQAKVNTYSGAIAQATNSFEDLQKAIGEIIVQNPTVISTIHEVSKIFQELAEYVNQNSASLKLFISSGLTAFLDVAINVVDALDKLTRTFQVFIGIQQVALIGLAPLILFLSTLHFGLDKTREAVALFADIAGKNLTAFGESGRGALSGIEDGLKRLKDASAFKLDPSLFNGIKGLEDTTQKFSLYTVPTFFNAVTGMEEPLNRAAGATKNLTDEQKRALERLKEFGVALVRQSEDAKASADRQLEVIKAFGDSELALQQDLLNQKEITEVDFLNSKVALEQQYADAQAELEQKQFADSNARLQQALATRQISEQEYFVAKNQLAENFKATDAKRDAANTAREIANRKAVKDADQKLTQERLGYASEFFGNLSALMQTKSRELFEIGKAAAVAQAFIDSQAAIVKTMASVPYPFNIPLAAAQGIAGAVRVANIVATQPSFEDGGIVPGNSFRGDNVSVNVNSSEMILNRQQQSRLFAIANGAGAGEGIDYQRLGAAIVSALGYQPIVVNVGGRTVVDTIRSELNAGRSFA